MEDHQAGEFVSETFRWTIENFSQLKTKKHYSEVFLVGDWKWRILVFPKGNNVQQLSLYLDAVDASDLPFMWTRYAQFSLTVVNQLSDNRSITKNTQHDFHASESDWGFTSFMPLSEFCLSSKGFLWNDKCIVEAKVAVRKADIKILEDQGTGSSEPIEPSEDEDQWKEPSIVSSVKVPYSSVAFTAPTSEQMLALQDLHISELVQPNADLQVPDSSKAPILPNSEQVLAFQDAPGSKQVCLEPADSPVEPSLVEGHGELLSTPVGKAMDFRGLGKIDKAFVPLLEEVCAWDPSLIACQQKRSRVFTEWAFTALGRVLHFLKTTKVKDMSEDACEHLQLLWEELETFKFDLAWLEPCVQYALDAKKLVQRAEQVKKLREDVGALEIEVKRLRARVAVAEVDLEVAKRDLTKAEESFGETNMDRELGYWALGLL